MYIIFWDVNCWNIKMHRHYVKQQGDKLFFVKYQAAKHWIYSNKSWPRIYAVGSSISKNTDSLTLCRAQDHSEPLWAAIVALRSSYQLQIIK